MKRLTQHGGWDASLEAKAREVLTLRYSELSDSLEFGQACQRPDGSVYGTSGQCRKGKPIELKEEKPKKEREARAKKEPKKEPPANAESKGLFMAGKDVDIWEVDQKAEAWRKEAGLQAFPGTVDYKHDRVHALTHEFLGGTNKISEWIGHGKTPTPAEETLVNMIHRASALKGRGDNPKELYSDEQIARLISKDIQFVTGRGQIKDEDLKYYYKPDGEVNTDKFVKKYREMEASPNWDRFLDASYAVWSNVEDFVNLS